jgi:hypothetical protein
MTRTTRYIISLLALAFGLGLALLLTLAWPAAAEPVEVTPLPPVAQTDGRAGACFSYYPDPQTGTGRPFVQMARDAGSHWDRFDFAWPRLEPANDYWDPVVRDGYDTLVDDLHEAGTNMVGILLWTPDWAATSGLQGLTVPSLDQAPRGWRALAGHDDQTRMAPLVPSAASSPPRGLYEKWSDWTGEDGDPINYWGRFVYQVVARYGDRVKHWEVWNEPEWSFFWTGTSGDYARLLKVGYQATKAACPDCKVLFGGLHYWLNPSYYRWVLGALDAEPTSSQNNHFFDVMSVHLYSRSSSVYDEVNNIRSGMQVYNVADHPIWLTETGVPVWGDPQVAYNPKYDFAATQDEAASYLIQSYANAWASGVERYFFFRTHDSDMTEYFGLIRNDYSLRPAYVAYQVATTYLISPTFVTHKLTGPHRSVTLWGTPWGKVSTLWNESAVTGVYTLPAALPVAIFVDRWGVTRTVTATSALIGAEEYAVHTGTLPAATANLVSNPDDYIIGGDPLLIVESEEFNEPPTSTIHILPGITSWSTVTVTWEGRDNQSGVWTYDVQVRDGVNGGWSDWQTSTVVTSCQFAGEYGHTYYFRSRATDRVGNRAPWPEKPQAAVTLTLSSELRFSVGAFFNDDNRNDVWDKPITGTGTISFTPEVTLTGVSLRFRDASGADVVTPTVGNAWSFTTTILAGKPYQFQAVITGYRRSLWRSWPSASEVYTLTYPAFGLWPMEQIYLPSVLRHS